LDYTPGGWEERELFECLQRRLFGELPFAVAARDEIDRFPDRHGGSKIQADASVITGCTGDLFEMIGDVRLGAEIELHIGIDGKTVEALLTHPPPFAVRLHETLINAEARLLADGAFRGPQSLLDFLNGRSRHGLSLSPGV
jgi:hypothetical protein